MRSAGRAPRAPMASVVSWLGCPCLPPAVWARGRTPTPPPSRLGPSPKRREGGKGNLAIRTRPRPAGQPGATRLHSGRMAEVTLRHVQKSFGPVTVIEDLDLDVEDHEFMVLVGPSGCGKSTALRMIAGLEEATGGTLAIGGRVVNDVPPKDRDIAMVFQSYALYPHMTVRENLEFGLKIRKTPAPEIARLVGETAAILGLGEYLDRKPKQLSGGQRQRVAVGRAIVRQP